MVGLCMGYCRLMPPLDTGCETERGGRAVQVFPHEPRLHAALHDSRGSRRTGVRPENPDGAGIVGPLWLGGKVEWGICR